MPTAHTIRYVDPDGIWHIDPSDDLLIREDGRVEWLCPHGVGHAIGHVRAWHDWMAIHGCDGCCGDLL